ncbi:MAG TPA: hypothetical protein DCR40_15030 [Prolixibacteraceae bacterium]|nr:hypothetical protein [Prolixibacteraceae bacterium]
MKPHLNIWYGLNQTFGHNGFTQHQINILGNIENYRHGLSAYFILNNNPEKKYLTIGSDTNRLAEKGDFNIEIGRINLVKGLNTIKVSLVGNSTDTLTETINVNFLAEGHLSLPYFINWSEVKNIQDAVDVADGKWQLTNDGIRPEYKYYDRMIAFGDSSWSDYEVTTSVIFHGFNKPEPGPPTYNVAHAAIATRWPGHDADNHQPFRKWFPLGATSEFQINENYENCRWRIFDGEYFYAEQSPKAYRKILPETKYYMKHRVESISEYQTLFSVKLWPTSDNEPTNWDFQAIKIGNSSNKGSCALIAHHTDVTFGNIEVLPVIKTKY